MLVSRPCTHTSLCAFDVKGLPLSEGGRSAKNIVNSELESPHQDTVRCRFNAVNFLTNIYERHRIARP